MGADTNSLGSLATTTMTSRVCSLQYQRKKQRSACEIGRLAQNRGATINRRPPSTRQPPMTMRVANEGAQMRHPRPHPATGRANWDWQANSLATS